MRKYQVAKILIVSALTALYFEYVHPHIVNLWRGFPFIRGFILLEPNIGIKNALVEQLNRQEFIFNIAGDEKFLPVCKFDIQTNNIHFHSYGDEEFPIKVCRNIKTNIFKSIAAQVNLPFYFDQNTRC